MFCFFLVLSFFFSFFFLIEVFITLLSLWEFLCIFQVNVLNNLVPLSHEFHLLCDSGEFLGKLDPST